MNIIYLHCHDAGRSIEPYGEPVATPNLADFSHGATLFRNAHCCAPTCSPSRAALLTGESAHEAGMLGLAHRGFSLARPERHLSTWLKKNHGYKIYLSGIQHVYAFHQPDAMPYDEVLSPHNPGTRMNDPIRDLRVGEAAAAFLEKTSPKDGNVLLECGFFFPHRTFPETDTPVNPDYVAVPAALPDNEKTREDMVGYHAAVSNMDKAFGVVWKALRENGWLENSFVFFTTDHGIPFPWYKCQLSDRGTGVALMVRPPSALPRAEVSDALVSHLDLFPTICDYAGLAAPDWLQGTSLRPALEGKKDVLNEEVFAEVSYHAAYEPKRSVRSERFRYVRNFELRYHPALANIDAGVAKDWMREEGMLSYTVPSEEFYDCWADPLETNNLIDDPRYQDDVACLRKRLDGWMKRTSDPVLKGHIAPPAGATITRPRSTDPRKDVMQISEDYKEGDLLQTP